MDPSSTGDTRHRGALQKFLNFGQALAYRAAAMGLLQ
jgi:hypothetical protein